MRLLRTPGERFRGRPGFGHIPQHAEVPEGAGGSALRMA
jgi:hypothetical protein